MWKVWLINNITQGLAIFPLVYWVVWITDQYLRRAVISRAVAAALTPAQMSDVLKRFGPLPTWQVVLWAGAICAGLTFYRWSLG